MIIATKFIVAVFYTNADIVFFLEFSSILANCIINKYQKFNRLIIIYSINILSVIIKN